MTIEFEDLLKHSVVISVDDSICRRFIDLFEWQNLKPIPRLYRGMKLHGIDWDSDSTFASFGQTQCMYSHLSIVKMAKFLDWPFVCIFEDDAYPCQDCRQWLEDSLKDLPDDIECLVLGHCYIEKHKYEKSTKISCCDMLFGSQAYVIFKNGYDDYVNLTERQNCLADRILDRMSNSYCIDHNLFIQYNNKESSVSHRNGYIWWKDINANKYSDDIIFSQFPKIEDIDCIANSQNEKKNVVILNYFVNKKYNSTLNIMEWFFNMKNHYLIDCSRKFVIFTDNIDAQKIIQDDLIEWVIVDESQTQDITKNLIKKFNYINDWISSHDCAEIDYVSFIQSNARCRKNIMLNECISNEYDGLLVKHSLFAAGRSFIDLNGGLNAGTCADLTNVDYNNFTYVHAGIFTFRIDLAKDICQHISTMVDEDISKSVYPSWHDESYLNYLVNTSLKSRYSFKFVDGNEYANSFYSRHDICPKIQLLTKREYDFSVKTKSLSLDDIFKNSFVISLSEQRLQAFYERLKRQNIDIMPRRFIGCMMKNATSEYWKQKTDSIETLMLNTFGTCSSHRGIISIAKALDLPFVMIFEDDALPIDNLKSYMKICLENIPDTADILVFGWTRCQDVNIDKEKQMTAYYSKLSNSPGNFAGAQCYIVFKNAYDRYLEVFNNIEFIADRIWFFIENTYISNINVFVQTDNYGNIIWYESSKSYDNIKAEYKKT